MYTERSSTPGHIYSVRYLRALFGEGTITEIWADEGWQQIAKVESDTTVTVTLINGGVIDCPLDALVEIR